VKVSVSATFSLFSFRFVVKEVDEDFFVILFL